MWPFTSQPRIPVLRLTGTIGMAAPLRPSLSVATVAHAIERLFTYSKEPAVAVVVNSPGGSPVQSNLIFKRMRQLAKEKEKKVSNKERTTVVVAKAKKEIITMKILMVSYIRFINNNNN